MRCYLPGFAAAVLVLTACGDAADDPVEPPAPRIWSDRVTTLVVGSSAIKITVVLERAATVSYAIYGRTQSGMTATEVKSEAAGTGSGLPRAGTFTVDQDQIGDTASVELDGFLPATNVFVYLAADPLVADPQPEDLDRVVPLSATTARRQPSQSYQSLAVGTTVGYYTYLPDAHYLHPAESFALLVFLHGSAEQGNGTTELSRVLAHGPPKLISLGRDFPFIVVSPQLPVSEGEWPVALVDEVIARVRSNARVDVARVYLTGLDLGGIGTWEYAVARPAAVAAVVPIAGSGDTAQACGMRDVPVWAFHGDADATVAVSGSVDMVTALNACVPVPSEPPMLTVYPGVGHDSWTRTYDGSAGHDIYSWLLMHQR